MSLFKNLSLNEIRTFKLHLFYSFIDGIAGGALILNEFIFIKSLKGSNVQLMLLFQFSMLVFLFAMVANEILRRYTNRKLMLRIIGSVTSLPLISFIFFPNVTSEGLPFIYHLFFLAIFLLFYTSKIAVVPSINQYLRGNYRTEVFGRLYSYSTTVSRISMMISTFLIGMLLDINPNAFKYFYPLVGILGVISIFQLTKIEFVFQSQKVTRSIWNALSDSFKRIFQILKINRAFRDLEIGFMLYGFAWMSTHAVITIFYDRVLHLNYSSVAFYNNAFNLVAIMVLPFFGRLIGNKDPRRFGIITFVSLMLFIVFTGLTQWYDSYTEIWGIKLYYSLLLAVIFNGIFMGSMPILWSIGSSYFCKSEEAADYQSLHLFLTGARALFAPIIGITLYEWYGFSVTFVVGVVLLFLAMVLMRYSEKHVS